ncbi:MAG: hypothetical protein Tsb0020_48930 [Haliangiales bacterium]
MGLRVHDERLTGQVGAATLVATLAVIGGLFALARCDLRDHIAARVYYTNVGPLREGAEVQVAGRVIGRVSAISLVPGHVSAGTEHPLAGQDGVAVHLRVQARYADMAPSNGEYFISAKGILGERFVEIGPPADGGPPARPLRSGDAIRGIDAPHLDRALWRGYASMMASRQFLQEIAPHAHKLVRFVDQLVTTLESMDAISRGRALGGSLRALTRESRQLLESWRQSQLSWAEVSALQARTRALIARGQEAVADARVRAQRLRDTLARIDGQIPPDLRQRVLAILDQIQATLAKGEHIMATIDELIALVERGQGTVGSLLNDPEFVDDAKSLGKTLKRHPWRVVSPPPAD